MTVIQLPDLSPRARGRFFAMYNLMCDPDPPDQIGGRDEPTA